MSDAELTRFVLREFRMNGITLKRDALEAIVSVVRRELDAEGALRLIMNTIQERLRRSGGDAVAVDRDMVAAAVEESSREEDDRRREALQIVSAFKAPSFKFNAARKSYHPDSSARPLHGTAKDKVAMLRQRFASVRQRLSRNPRFRKPVSAKAAKESPWVELITVDALRSKEGEVATVLGMIVPAAAGSASRWALEDLHSRVPLDVESCRRMPGLYTESCIVLVQGRLDDDGVFRAWNVGMPPPEARTDSLLALGVVDQYQLLRTPAEWEAASALEERDASAQFCVFSDCSMDKDIVRARLRRCLETYDSSDDVPRLIVLCGPFQSAPFGAQSGARRAFTASMSALADIFASTPNIAARSQIVLVPAAGDPGSASVLPRAPLPSVLCEPVRRVVRRLALASNPCRILFHTQEIVVFRDNASSRMRRHCIIRPKDDAEDEADADADAADGAATATASGAESAGAGAGGDGDSDEEGDAPRGGVPLTTEPGGGFSLMSGSDRAISQHIASTIVSQGHLCPLPLSVQPVYWAHDVGLRLFPLPDVVVLADDQDLFVREQVPVIVRTVVADSVAAGKLTTFVADAGGKRVPLLLARTGDGKLHATVNRCPHYGLPLSKGVVADGCISCPFHGAQFSLETGDIEDGPSMDKLPVYPVSVAADGFAYVELPGAEPSLALTPAYASAGASSDASVVIVGAGAASQGAVEELTAGGFAGSITIIAREGPGENHIDRTKLSKNLAMGSDLERIALRGPAWWTARSVKLLLGRTAVEIDRAGSQVRLSDGGSVRFTSLIVATGGRARRMDGSDGPGAPSMDGASLLGAFVCKDAGDAKAILQAARAAGPRGSVVIVGAGFVGMEVAASIAGLLLLASPHERQIGSVTVVGSGAEPFERAIGPELGGAMRAVHEANGVAFRMGVRAVSIRPSADAPERVGAVILSDGSELRADVVVIGAGIVPKAELLAKVPGAVLDRGAVHVDASMRVRPGANLYAAGDIAVFPVARPLPKQPSRMRLEHWNAAMSQGRVAARAIMGKEGAVFDKVPFFSTGQFGTNVRVAGHAHTWDAVLVQGALGADPQATAYFSVADTIVMVATIQNDPLAVAAREAMRIGVMPTLTEVKAEDPFDLLAAQQEAQDRDRPAKQKLRRGASRPRLDDKERIRAAQTQAVPKPLQGRRLKLAGAALRGEWTAPSTQHAVEHANSVHPRTRDAMDDVVPWSVCDTRAGRFCFPSCDPLCCYQPSASDLSAMGPGISSYFKLVKAFAWLFLIWTLFTLPMDVMVTFGTRNTTLPEATAFAEVTLGQLGADPNVTDVEVVGTDCAGVGQPSSPCLVTKLQAAQVFTISDLIAMSVWCVAYIWIRVMEKREAHAIDVDHLTIQDYSVHLTAVPPFAKAEHIRKHFEAITGEASVADVQVAEDDAELLRIFVKRGRLIKRITDLTEQQAKAQALGRHSLEKRLLTRRNAIKEKIKLLNGKARAVQTNNRSLAAFVTFDRRADMSRVTKMYRSRGVCSAFLQPRRLRMSVPDPTQRPKSRMAAAAKAAGGQAAAPEARQLDESTLPDVTVRVRVKAAPPPSTIMWHNLHFSWCARMQRRSVTAVLSAVLLVLSVVAGVLASVQQAQLASASGGGTCASSSSADALKTAATGPEATKEDVYCYCQFLGQHDAVAFAKEGRLCADWASNVAITTVATVAAAAVVPVVNGVFKILLKVMSEWEAHHSLNSQAESYSQRLFLLTVINTSILPLLINARIPFLSLPGNQFEDLVPVWYATVGVQITLTMLINAFVPHATPILRYLFVLAVRRGYCHERGCSVSCFGDPSQRAVSQRQLNSWFEGPQFHLDTRYATIMQSVFVTLVFGAVLPLLVPIAFVGMVISFYVDKWLLLRFYRIPPHYDVHLGRALTSWIPWAIFLHLGFTAYAMSTPAIFASVAADVGVFGEVTSAAEAANGTLRELIQRLQQTHVFSLTVAALIVLLFTILSKFVSGLTQCSRVCFAVLTCGACAERPMDRVSLACASTSFSEARDGGKLSGLVSYSLMQNPDIADAMAIALDVAKTKKRVIEFRDEIPDDDEARVAAQAETTAEAAAGLGGQDSKAAPPATAAATPGSASTGAGALLAGDTAADREDHTELVMLDRHVAPPPRPPLEISNPAFSDDATDPRSAGFRGADTPRTRFGHRRPGEGGESRGTFTGVQRRVFGSDMDAGGDWTDAAPGRRLRREEAEAEAREAMVLGRDVSLRMLSAWRRGEDSAAAEQAAQLGAQYVQTDLDDSDSSADSEADSGAHGWPAGRAGVGGESGMMVTPVAAVGRPESSGMIISPTARGATSGSGMVITPVGMPAGAPRPLAAAPGGAAGPDGAFNFDLDEQSDSSEEESRVMHRAGIPSNDWDVDEHRPVRWTGYGGVLQPHADADTGERDD